MSDLLLRSLLMWQAEERHTEVLSDPTLLIHHAFLVKKAWESLHLLNVLLFQPMVCQADEEESHKRRYLLPKCHGESTDIEMSFFLQRIFLPRKAAIRETIPLLLKLPLQSFYERPPEGPVVPSCFP